MVLTVKDLITTSNIHDLKVICGKEEMNREIKGIKIIEVENIEKYLREGELILASFLVYQDCTSSQFEEHLKKILQLNVAGFVVKTRDGFEKYKFKYDILKKYCREGNIPLLEISSKESFWNIIRYVLKEVYDDDRGQLKYHKLMNDNFKALVFDNNASPKEIIELLSMIIENPIELYSDDFNCLDLENKKDTKLIRNQQIVEFDPGIISKYHYKKQVYQDFNQYIILITTIYQANINIVINEKKRKLVDLDFIAIENAIDTLRYSFTFEFARNEIKKKYHKDIIYNMINSQLNYNQTTEAARMLGLKEDEYYRIVSFHSIQENKEGIYTEEQLDEIELITREISSFYPNEHIYKNVTQIIMLQKMDSDKEDQKSLERIQNLLKLVRNNILHRNKEIDFDIGIGQIVKGYRNLQLSYKQSIIAMNFMSSARRITGDQNKSIVHYSKLGFLQIFAEIENPDKLLKYIPGSVLKLYEYDHKQNSELVLTLESYLRNNLSIKKTSEDLCIHYRSVSYRLDKIVDITNINFHDSVEILAIKNGLIIYEMSKKLRN